jgi:acyl carrier protein
VTTTAEIAATVYGILRGRGAAPEAIAGDVPLGARGLGLDSIAIAEVLIDCEQRFGGAFADLLDGPAITAGALVARAEKLGG